MADYRKNFPSKYLKAVDLDGIPHRAIIYRVTQQDVFDEQKLVCEFVDGKPKDLVLNKTMCDALAELAGTPDYEQWSDCIVELYPTTADYRGKTHDVVRVRAPRKPLPPEAEHGDELNDPPF